MPSGPGQLALPRVGREHWIVCVFQVAHAVTRQSANNVCRTSALTRGLGHPYPWGGRQCGEPGDSGC
eukprot:15455072-Alexandrium_andersonii.AAC.1